MPALTPATDPMHLLAPAGRRPLLQRPGEPARHAPGHSRSAPGRGIARGFTLASDYRLNPYAFHVDGIGGAGCSGGGAAGGGAGLRPNRRLE